MAGRIRDDDIAEVRDKARIDEIVGDYVTLKRAGGGSLKGLCPFHDEKSPSFHVTPSRGFFHCLAGETRVLTSEGVRPIRELSGGVHRVLNPHADWVEAPFRSYGVQPLMRITLTRNRQVKEIFATDEHRWFVRSGTGLRSRREVLTRDLQPGQSLAFTFPRSRIRRSRPSPFGIAHGITFGDGTRAGTGSRAQLCPPKDLDLLKWFPHSHTSTSGDNLLVHDLPRAFKELPDLHESVSYLYGWLAGYFAADGCVATDGTVMLNSASRDHLEFVRAVCTRLGIGTYGITTQVREGFPGREPSELHRVHLVNADLPDDFFLIGEHQRRFVAVHKAFARRGWVVRSVERTDRVEEVFCAEVDEGHAFTLEDNILTGNCFGCQEGGDVISFLMKIDGLSFGEAVERLADKTGVALRREDGPAPDRPRGPARGRLIEAHAVAREFYAEQLATADAQAARDFLTSRGFDQAAAEHFGVGFAPRGGEVLVRHLRGRGFSEEEMVAAGLVAQGRSAYDRFRGRLLWPIREPNGDTIGFGARRIFDDDRIDAKYLNTPETAIYKKSQVLYGIDLARDSIRTTHQAVVVEGYTDVMACHLAGVTTAVASCGTAFGEDHARVMRRFIDTHGEVVFTFDGDEAGQRAAMKVFTGVQDLASQAYVAVAPEGKDPCDLRLAEGDAALRELVATRRPLYRFALRTVLARYDLDRADARVDALREAAEVVAAVRDRTKVDAFAREIAGMVGVEVEEARAEVRRAAARPPSQRGDQRGERRPDGGTAPAPPAPPGRDLPRLDDPRFAIERETLKLVVQHPAAVVRATTHVTTDDFTHPTFRGVWDVVAASGGPRAGAEDPGWATRVRDRAGDPAVSAAISELGVEPLKVSGEPSPAYVVAHVYRLQELTTTRRITDLKSRLQRTNPIDHATDYNRMFGELVALEAHRRTLRDHQAGSQ